MISCDVVPVVTLLTDFGTSDPYVGVMKGVILTICPSARIVDITHHVPPQDIAAAALALSAAYRYFPLNTIHVAVVDPGVGTGRRIIMAETPNGTFLAPDNGILSEILDEAPADCLLSVENSDIFLYPVSPTFHGRDIFAPAAAHLACGVDPKLLGSEVEPHTLVRSELFPKPQIIAGGAIEGAVVTIDHFGNLITNIRETELAGMIGSVQVEVLTGELRIAGISRTYQAVPAGAPLALIGSTGRLEIAVNQGDARHLLDTARGDRVIVRRLAGG